ncbi:MAG: M48 family metalloprotease [Saprospiraceae bacterium]|nr:M48 family metalloprotease [Saprospiraceae bacterium]
MNYDKHCFKPFLRLSALLVFGPILFFACQGDLPDISDEQSFPKEKLETLGSMLRNELLIQHEFLAEQSPYDTSVYWYVQTLYNQVTNVMHLDKQSPVFNKWDQERLWKVYVIKSEERLAFTLPGGDFFISTAMLKSFEKDYELYALMSFEAKLMNDGHLLSQWLKSYNSLTINNLIEGKDQPNPLTAEALATEMLDITFAPTVVETVDKSSIDNTCNTSILSPLGLMPFIENAEFSSSKWLQTRPSYDGREQLLPDFADDNCKARQQGSNYERFVLKPLN